MISTAVFCALLFIVVACAAFLIGFGGHIVPAGLAFVLGAGPLMSIFPYSAPLIVLVTFLFHSLGKRRLKLLTPPPE